MSEDECRVPVVWLIEMPLTSRLTSSFFFPPPHAAAVELKPASATTMARHINFTILVDVVGLMEAPVSGTKQLCEARRNKACELFNLYVAPAGAICKVQLVLAC